MSFVLHDLTFTKDVKIGMTENFPKISVFADSTKRDMLFDQSVDLISLHVYARVVRHFISLKF